MAELKFIASIKAHPDLLPETKEITEALHELMQKRTEGLSVETRQQTRRVEITSEVRR